MRFSWVKIVITLLLVVWYFVMPRIGFLSGDVAGHCLYPLSHANIWHLSANILCLWMIPCPTHLLSSFFVAVVCSYLPCFTSEVTYGFSGVLFAIVGMSWGRVRKFKGMLWKNKLFLLIPLFLPQVNGVLHVYCLLGGWLLGRFVGTGSILQKTKDWL